MGHEPATPTHQLSELLAHGLITHILPAPTDGRVWSINPLTLRDIKEMKLMAILDDGTVAISCPNGLPEFIRDAATPIDHAAFEDKAVSQVTDEASDKIDQLLAALSKVDALSDRLDATGQALAAASAPNQPPDVDPQVLNRLDEIASALQSMLSAPTPAPEIQESDEPEFSTQLENIGERLATLAAALENSPTLSQLQEALVTLADRIETSRAPGISQEDLTSVLADMPLHPDTSGMDQILSVIAERLDHVSKMPAQRVEMAPIHQAMARQTTVMAMIVERIEEALSGKGDQEPPQDNSLILSRLDSLQEAVTARDPADDRFGDLFALSQRMAADIERLADAPTPVAPADATDLIHVRQQMARYATAQATVLRRLEAVVDRLAIPQTQPLEGQNSAATAADQTVAETLADESAVVAPVQGLSDDLTAEIRGGPLQIAALSPDQRVAIAEQIAMALWQAQASQ